MKRLLITVAFASVIPLTAFAGESGVTPDVISLPDGPGSVEGLGEEFEPSANSGMASYGVGITIPEGSGGFKPDIKLLYSGGGGNSTLGFGWSMPLPRIQRETTKGLPRYDDTDTYIYNDDKMSEELVPLADGSYRLKNERAMPAGTQAFIRARPDGVGWEVRTKSGVIYRLGANAASRVTDAAGIRTFIWNITGMEDTSGNLISFEWFADGGQSYLERIIYNNHSSSAVCEISFSYEVRTDALADYRATYPVITARRLTAIEVRRGGNLVRSYVLNYDQGSNLSRLARITFVGADGSTSLPPLSFAYTQFAPADQPIVVMDNPPGRALIDPKNALVDLNKDGLPDFIVTQSGDHRYYLNEDGLTWTSQRAMTTSPSYELSQDGVRLADITGDGVSDLVVARGANGNSYFAGTGDAAWQTSVPFDANPVGFDPDDANTRFVDLNGDRLIDVIRTNLTGVSAWIHEGGGAYERLGSLPRIDDSENVSFDDPQILLADFNGDGLLDVARLRSGSLIYWPSMGYGLFDEPMSVMGAPDVDDETKLRIADLNGDGLADIVYLGVSHVGYWLNRGDGSFDGEVDITNTPPVHPTNTAIQFADMNGNGTTDIVWVDISGGPAGSWQYLDPIGDQFAGLITRIDNGLGKRVTVTYESSTAQMIRALDGGSPWSSVVPFPVQVIREVTVDDGLGAKAISEYAYRDGYYDGTEREFRGFAGASARALGDGSIDALITSSTFDVGKINEALKGCTISETLADDAGAVYRSTANTWHAGVLESGLDGRDVVLGYLDTTVTAHVEGSKAPKYTRIDYLYDEYGNITNELNHGLVASAADDGSTPTGDDEVFIHRSFAVNETNWVLDRVARERVRDGAGNRVKDTLYYYDGAVFEGLPLGQVDSGLLMKQESWLDTENRYVPMTRNRYDAWGNVTAILDANGGRREIFYDDDSHTYPVRERIFAGSYALGFTATYDRIFGKIESIADPNGATTAYDYDALGRLSSVIKPGDSNGFPTMTYKYVLGAPTSLIATHAREVSGGEGTLDTFAYIDGLGRVRAELTEDEGGFAVTKAIQYNARGKESFITEPFRIAALPLEGGGLGGGERPGTHLYYDALARVTQTINPDGTAAHTEYLPLAERLFDENDADAASPHADTPATKTYDGQGRIIATVFKDGTRDLTTQFGYDAMGNLRFIIDPAGNERTMVFDTMGRMIAQDDPNAGHRAYAYDDAGNLIEKIKPDAKRVRFQYEPTTNRVLAKNLVSAADDDTWEVKYHYDVPSPSWDRHGSYLKGRLAWVEDEAGSEYYGYDARGNIVAKRREIEGSGFEMAYAFDAMDRETSTTYPDGTVLARSYDARGLLESVGDYLKDRTYTASGQVDAEALGGGIGKGFAYDARRRVTDITATDISGNVIQQFHYTFDNVGNVTGIDDGRTGLAPKLNQTQDFGYDDLYRLTTAEMTEGSIAWAYDDVGNITGKSSTIDDARFNVPDIRYGENGAGPYAVTTHGDTLLSYDANGNLIGIESESALPSGALAYDAEDRLTGFTRDDGVTVDMAYDFTGQRKLKRVCDVIPTGAEGSLAVKALSSCSSPSDVLYAFPEYELRGDRAYRYIWVDGRRIARVESSTGYMVHSTEYEQSYAFGGIKNPSSPLRGEGWVGVMGFTARPPKHWWREGGWSGWGWFAQRNEALPISLQLLFICLVLLLKYVILSERKARVEGSLAVRFVRCFNSLTPRRALVTFLIATLALGPMAASLSGCAGGGSDNASTDIVAQPGTIYYISDHLGSSHLITDSLGTIVREESRYPYGLERQVNGEGSTVNGSSTTADYVFTGKEYDEETGLIYFGKRYYVPALGRWTTPDPLFLEKEPAGIVSNPLSYNLYAYVRGNPMTYIDPNGWFENERDMFPGAFPEPAKALPPKNVYDQIVVESIFITATAGLAGPLLSDDGSVDIRIPKSVPVVGGYEISIAESASLGIFSISTTGEAFFGVASLGISLDVSIGKPDMVTYGSVSVGLGKNVVLSMPLGVDQEGEPAWALKGSIGPGFGPPVSASVTKECLEDLNDMLDL